MLVLTRKRQESLWIDDRVRITVVRISRDRVRLGVEAPKDMRILREELLPELWAEASSQSSSACGDD